MAFSLGSSRWRVFRTVTLPLTVPGIANAFLLLFAASLADFATPLILAGNSFPILPTQAYLQITGLFDLKGGAVLSFVLLVPAFAVFLLQRFWVGRKYYVTITGKVGAKTEIKSVPPWMRTVLLVVCLLISASILYFYVLLFYASIVKAFGADFTITWRHYHVVFAEGLQAIRDTLIIAGIGMPLGGIYSVVVGTWSARRVHLPPTMEIVSMINYSPARDHRRDRLPSGLQRPPILLTGTAIIIIACSLPLRPDGDPHDRGDPSADHPSIEEASFSLGASSGTTFRRITLP
jgi:iron(III) transport system permease protein